MLLPFYKGKPTGNGDDTSQANLGVVDIHLDPEGIVVEVDRRRAATGTDFETLGLAKLAVVIPVAIRKFGGQPVRFGKVDVGFRTRDQDVGNIGKLEVEGLEGDEVGKAGKANLAALSFMARK